MAEEETKEKTTPEAVPPADKQIAEVEPSETAEKPEETPEEETEGQDVKMVPLTELQKERERRRQLEEHLLTNPPTETPQTSQFGDEAPQLEPDADTAVRIAARQEAAVEYEQRKATDFASKHKEELSDPLLASRVQSLIREANTKNQYIDQEQALSQAKKELNEWVNPQVKQAKSEGFEEGKQITKEKGKLGVIGETRPKEKVDPSKLSAKEYADYLNLPRER